MARGSGVEGLCGDEEPEVVVGGRVGFNGSGVGARAADTGAPLTSWSKDEVMVIFAIYRNICDHQNQRPWRPSAVVIVNEEERERGTGMEKIGREDADRSDIIVSAFPLFRVVYSFSSFIHFTAHSIQLQLIHYIYTEEKLSLQLSLRLPCRRLLNSSDSSGSNVCA